jgi:hypothetical protein
MRICPHSLTWIGLPDVLNCTMIHDPMIHMTNNLQLSGFVLFGISQMMVGLENSQWLRIPLSAFPVLQNLHEDEWLDYRLAANRTRLRWPGRDISLSVRDLASHATSMDDGGKGPE